MKIKIDNLFYLETEANMIQFEELLKKYKKSKSKSYINDDIAEFFISNGFQSKILKRYWYSPSAVKQRKSMALPKGLQVDIRTLSSNN